MADDNELMDRVKALMKADKYGAARELLLANDVLVRSRADLSWRMGWACFKLDLFPDACDWLENSLKLKPTNPGVRWILGEAYAALDRVDDAERELLRSIVWMDSQDARQSLGFLYHRRGRLEEAEAVYVEGLRLRPQDADRCEAYAAFLSDTGREDEASEYQRRAELAQRTAQSGEPSASTP